MLLSIRRLKKYQNQIKKRKTVYKTIVINKQMTILTKKYKTNRFKSYLKKYNKLTNKYRMKIDYNHLVVFIIWEKICKTIYIG